MYIDFHTHAFADKIVEKAMAHLVATSGFTPVTDGTVNGLKERMKKSGVDASVILPIATKPTQQEIINNWAAELNNKDGLYCFGSVHPYAEDALECLDKIKDRGLYGIKLHPDYQGFIVDDEKAFPIYQKCADLGIPITFHAGFDPLSPEFIHAMPKSFLNIHNTFPNLIMIVAHLGGMYRWEGVERYLSGLKDNVYFDLAFVAGEIGEKQLARIISKHGADKILLGSDCPWDDPANEIAMIEKLPLSHEEKELIFYKNALKILNISEKSV